jgi:hypothetical protein
LSIRCQLSLEEIHAALDRSNWPVILSPGQLAELIGRKRATVYDWIRKGRLDGCFRRRGRGILLWRDRCLKIIFSGPDWRDDT